MVKLKGAEAELIPATFFNTPCLVKIRLPKRYRSPALDKQLRRERTKIEARLLHKAKLSGVRCPLVLYVDLDRCEIFQTKLKGKLLAGGKFPAKAYTNAGEQLAKLHSAGINHGDSTTSNFFVCADAVWIFDLGLAQSSTSLEEEAIDILLFKKSVNSEQFRHFLSGYKQVRPAAVQSLLSKIEEIQLRARYAER